MATNYSTLITLSKSLPLEDLRALFEEVVTDLQATENDTRAATKDFLVDGDTLTQEEFDRLSLVEINDKVVEKMEATVADLKTAEGQVVSLQADVDDLVSEKQSLADQVSSLETENTELENDVASLSSERDEAQANLGLVEFKIIELEQNVTDLTESKKAVEHDVEMLQSDLDQERRVTEDLRSDIETLSNNMDTLNTELFNTKKELEKRDVTISELQQQNQALVDTTNAATAKAAEFEAENLRLAQKIEAEQQKVEELNKVVIELNREIGGYKNLVKEKDDRINLLQSQLNGVIAERDEAKAKVEAAITAKNAAIVDLDRTKEDLTVVQGQLQSANASIIDLNTKAGSLESTLKIVRDERDEVIESEEKLQVAYNVLDSQLETAIAELNKALDGLEAAETTILTLRAQIAQLEEELENSGDENLKAEIKDLKEEVLDLESDLEEFQHADKEWEEEIEGVKKSAKKRLLIVAGVLLVAAIIGFST